jgi:hypothetical protein
MVWTGPNPGRYRGVMEDRQGAPPRPRLRRWFLAGCALGTIFASVACFGNLLPSDGTSAPRRDKYLQPFSSTSIWNLPIGDGATYTPAGIGRVGNVTYDEEYWIVTDDSMPRRPLYTNETFYDGRCATARYEFDLPFPDDFTLPDIRWPNTPNNVAAVLLPDGRTIVQMNPLTRCEAGGPVTAGWLAPTADIYGDGVLGGHGGSHLSSIGGSLRLGELRSPAPVRHALKVNLDAHRFLSRAGGGYRWPATAADETALLPPEDPASYNGPVPALRMGSLLAIPSWVSLDSLGLRTDAGRKIAWTLQNYGAYVVDSSGWDAHAIAVQAGVPEEFQRDYGMDMQAERGDWYEDVVGIFQALHVVDNNGPDAVGGGGTPRQPLTPPIGN